MTTAIRWALLTTFACCVFAQPVLAAESPLPRYTGTFASHQTRTVGATKRRSAYKGAADLSFEVNPGTLFVGMQRRGGASWKQAFVTKSDMTGPDGTRVIEFERPADGSKMAELNRRALGPHPLLRVLGGFESMSGWGELTLAGDTLRFRNRGAGPLRLGFSKGLNTWDEVFEGSLRK